MAKKISLLILLAMLVSACGTAVATPLATATLYQYPTEIAAIKATNEATLSSTVNPTHYPPQVFNFLLLGGDYRQERAGTRYGDKTDVMLLVSIRMEDRPVITVLQFNRNFYHPVDAMDDMWLFHVYEREGFVGLHYYFQQVFDVDLHGIAYVNMDNFVAFVDEIGGLYYGEAWSDDSGGYIVEPFVHTGEQTLVYLRDNENNWNCGIYDCENRQFKVLMALAEKIKTKFGESPLETAEKLWTAYGYLFETDLSIFEQIHWLVELGWRVMVSEYQIAGVFKMDNSPHFIYDDTPLEVRGWIQREGYDIQEWAERYIGG